MMAIGLQPVGNVVVRDPSTGKFASLSRLRGFGRRIIGEWTEVETIEVERRPNPRPARAPVGRLVVLAALLAVGGMLRPDVTGWQIAAGCALSVAGVGGLALRWLRGYVRREFTSQWRLALAALAPSAAFLAWLMACRGY